MKIICWLGANWAVLLPVIIPFLASIANGLMNYPTAPVTNNKQRLGRLLGIIVDALSATSRRNSPDTFKAPLTPSQPPEGKS